MVSEADLLPLSGLQHLLFCERQCSLIHVEGVWRENGLTADGRDLHRIVDQPGSECRGTERTVWSLPLRSLSLGLAGRADAVEFHLRDGCWVPFPLEFKRGQRKRWLHNEVQLCAQAICLEEMLAVVVPRGALFYGRTRRRLEVEFTPELRQETSRAAARFRELVARRLTPVVARQPKCRSCALLDLCQPEATSGGRSFLYLQALMRSGGEATG